MKYLEENCRVVNPKQIGSSFCIGTEKEGGVSVVGRINREPIIGNN